MFAFKYKQDIYIIAYQCPFYTEIQIPKQNKLQ